MYDGSPDERKQLQKDQVEKGTFNVLITHYDLVMRDKSALRKVGLSVCLYLSVSVCLSVCRLSVSQSIFPACLIGYR